MKIIRVQPGDVGFTRGTGLFQQGIRYATRGPDEEPTWANHALMFTTGGAVGPAPKRTQATAIEALARVEENPWYSRHSTETGYHLMVYRPTFLSNNEKNRLVETARAHLGERYGWWKLFAHLIDRVAFDDRKVISNVLHVDDRPICSYLVARAYEVAGHPHAFGPIKAGAQDPDEMHDHVDDATWLSSPSWNYVGEFEVGE